MKQIETFEKEIQKIFSEEFSVKVINWALIFLFATLFTLIYVTFKSAQGTIKYALYAATAVNVILIYFLFRRKRRKNKAKELLSDAFHNIRRNNISESFGELISAYQLYRNSRLLEFIFILATQFQPDLQQQSVIISLELEKLKAQKQSDKKLLEILKQIVNLTESIEKHEQIIVKSKEKIQELEEQLAFTDEQEFINEYLNIIRRYEEIIEQEKLKIERNKEKVEHLLKMKNNFVITQKIIKAREELQRLEDELWESNISESIFENMNAPAKTIKPQGNLFIHDKATPKVEKEKNISGEAV